MQRAVGHEWARTCQEHRERLELADQMGCGVVLRLPPTTRSWLLPAFLPSLLPPCTAPQHSLLLFQLIGGCELIKQLSVHLHEGLEHIVDQRYDGS